MKSCICEKALSLHQFFVVAFAIVTAHHLTSPDQHLRIGNNFEQLAHFSYHNFEFQKGFIGHTMKLTLVTFTD